MHFLNAITSYNLNYLFFSRDLNVFIHDQWTSNFAGYGIYSNINKEKYKQQYENDIITNSRAYYL